MWRSISLRTRLNIMFASLFALWLALDAAHVVVEASARARAETQSAMRLTKDFAASSIARLEDAPEPGRALEALIGSLQNLRHVRVGLGEPSLASVMGLDDSVTERFAHWEDRSSAVDEVEKLVEDWTTTRDPLAVAETLQAVGIEAVPVADLGDASADPQLAHRGHFVTLDHPCMGPCGYERNGFRLSDAPAGYERTSPLLGEHNEMILGDILGLDAAERRRLEEEGVLE